MTYIYRIMLCLGTISRLLHIHKFHVNFAVSFNTKRNPTLLHGYLTIHFRICNRNYSKPIEMHTWCVRMVWRSQCVTVKCSVTSSGSATRKSSARVTLFGCVFLRRVVWRCWYISGRITQSACTNWNTTIGMKWVLANDCTNWVLKCNGHPFASIEVHIMPTKATVRCDNIELQPLFGWLN